MIKNYTTSTAALKATTIDSRLIAASGKIEVGAIVKDEQGNITKGTQITPDNITTKSITVEKDGVRTDLVQFVTNIAESTGIKGITKGNGITVDATTDNGLRPTVSVDTDVIATKQYVTDSIGALDSTNNGGNGIAVVQTNGVVSTTVTTATVIEGSITANGTNVVTADDSKSIADKAAADKIATELTPTTGSIAQAIETAKNAAIAGSKVTIKTGTVTEEIQELTLTDTSTSDDDVKISITPQENIESDGKINLKVSASTTTLAKKADTISAEGKNTTIADGTAPEVKVVLGGTVASPSLTVTATDIASATALSTLTQTVNDHIAAKGGALTIQIANSLDEITEPSTEVIYLIPAADSKDSNVKDEYIYVNGEFEKIGSTAVSLAGYATESYVTGITDTKADKSTTYTKTEVDTELAKKADQATTYTKTEVDTELAKKADKDTTYTKTEVDTALNGKADKTAVVSSINELNGAVTIKGMQGIEAGSFPNSESIYISETALVIDQTFFQAFIDAGIELSSFSNIVVTDSFLTAFVGGSGAMRQFVNMHKVTGIGIAELPITITDVDLPNCEILTNVTISGKVSCPNLTSATNVTLNSVETMLYLVDSLQTLSTENSTQVFSMSTTAANEDIELFNELNAELIAKGWTAGVTLV